MAHKVIRYNIDVAISVESCINELEKGNLLRCYRLVFAGRGLNKEAIASEKGISYTPRDFHKVLAKDS